MSSKQKSNQSARFPSFSGIDVRGAHNGIEGIADLVNFRITENGSLEKREGFQSVVSTYAPIRAVWTDKHEGKTVCMLLYGSTVALFDPSNGTLSPFGYTATSDGEAQFFHFKNQLYLKDNGQIYHVSLKELTPVTGYVPLIGKNWQSSRLGDAFEPRNYLTRQVRIHYRMEANCMPYLRTGGAVSSIDSVLLNGTPLDITDYSYNATYDAIVIEAATPVENDELIATFTYQNELDAEGKTMLYSCTAVESFGEENDTNILLYGGNQKNLVFYSSPVSEQALAEAQRVVPNATSLYFPVHQFFFPGDGRYDVSAFIHHYDRLLLFTEGNAWQVKSRNDGKTLFTSPINFHVGCVARNSIAMAENDPVTVGKYGIYRWTSQTDEHHENNALSISDPIAPLLSEDFLKNAGIHLNRRHQELWFYDKTGAQEEIFCFQISSKQWYRFDGIPAIGFFEYDGKNYFYSSSAIYVFDRSYIVDKRGNGAMIPILASMTTHLLEYGTTALKRFASLTLRADCDGGIIEVVLQGDGINAVHAQFSSSDTHLIETRALTSARFHHAVLTLSAPDAARQIIHSLISTTR